MQKNFFQPNIAVLFFIRRRVIDKDRAEWRTKMIGRINPLTNKIEGKDNFSRNRYVLVAVRSPDHHGLFVGDLAGGDGVDLLDVLDLGNGLHGCVFMCVIKVRKRWAPVLEESGRGSVSRKLFSWRHAFFFAAGGLVFFYE